MYPHLFSPLRIGELEIKNRIAMAPMGVEIIDDDGEVRERVIRYYEERARGGAGLLISEVCAVAYPRGATSTHQIALSDDLYLPGLRRLTERVHQHGAKIAAQLVHHGKVARVDTKQHRPLLVPSEPAFHGVMDMANDLSSEELGLLIGASGGLPKFHPASKLDLEQATSDFAEAVARARKAGFDAVEIHGAHGYLISSFLSRAWNLREDEYGGCIENRARLLCEILRAAKTRAGHDFPIWCRLDALEYRTPNGIVFEDALRTAELAVEAGADAIHLSAYQDATSGPGFTEGTLVHAEAKHVEHAAKIKERVDVPVIAVGRIEPDLAESIIRDGRADVIAMGRKMLADPEMAKKLEAGRPQDIRPCIYCYTCVAQAFFDRRVRCSVNPVTANEIDLAEAVRTPASERRTVAIAGGGPAGLEAARVAAARGHRVTLFEQSQQLGGTLRFAALAYEPNERLLNWLERQVQTAGVTVRLGEALTIDHVHALEADAVIVATGAQREPSSLPGANRPHVLDGEDLRALLSGAGAQGSPRSIGMFGRLAIQAGRWMGVTQSPRRLREWSKRYMPIGDSVVVIGGGLVGLELAEFFAERGRRVTVLHEGEVFGEALAHPRRWRLLEDLRNEGVELFKSVTLEEIEETAVRYREDEATFQVAAETVVITTGLVSNLSLAESLEANGIEPTVIGDCAGVGYIEGAIHEGFKAALAIGEPRATD